MKKILILTFLFPIFGQMDYIFSDNVQVTHFSNDQKFPEMIIHNDILHLTWVSVYGSNKNIMYAQSDDFGQTYTEPIQINYLNNNNDIKSDSSILIFAFAGWPDAGQSATNALKTLSLVYETYVV